SCPGGLVVSMRRYSCIHATAKSEYCRKCSAEIRDDAIARVSSAALISQYDRSVTPTIAVTITIITKLRTGICRQNRILPRQCNTLHLSRKAEPALSEAEGASISPAAKCWEAINTRETSTARDCAGPPHPSSDFLDKNLPPKRSSPGL